MARCVRVAIVDSEGNPKREFVQGSIRRVEAIQGEHYGIDIESTVDRELGVAAFVDGHYVIGHLLQPFMSLTISEAVTRSSIAGGAAKYVCNPLIFSHPKLVEDSDTPGTFAGSMDKLGTISVEVNEVIPIVPRAWRPPIVKKASMSATMSEADASRKGAFISITTLGPKERVVEKAQAVSSSRTRGQLIGTVEIRYGSRAALLFLGVPPELFDEPPAHDDDSDSEDSDDEGSESDDTDTDEAEDTRKKRRRRPSRRMKAGLPPPGPIRSSYRLALKKAKREAAEESV